MAKHKKLLPNNLLSGVENLLLKVFSENSQNILQFTEPPSLSVHRAMVYMAYGIRIVYVLFIVELLMSQKYAPVANFC